jgi:hypothetical protein
LLSQRTVLTLNQAEIDKLQPVLNDKPTYWWLTIPTSDAGQSEELVLSMQGVITNKDLPPVLHKYKIIIIVCVMGDKLIMNFLSSSDPLTKISDTSARTCN